MEVTIHVGVGERGEILALVLLLERQVTVVLGSVNSVDVLLLELSEHLGLDFSETLEAGLVLGGFF